MVAPLIQDIRYTLRLGRKSPGFFVCLILLLALGIGLNSAIFTLLDALLLRPLPVRKPRELVRLVQVAAPLGPRSFFTYNTYRALAQGNKSFTAFFAKYPHVRFERYADDAIVHCRTEMEAQEVRAAIAARLEECRFELHPEKTKIVYCKDDDRRRTYPNEKFDFLGYTFRPRRSKNRKGKHFINFSR